MSFQVGKYLYAEMAELGRRNRLKICRAARPVRVRFPFSVLYWGVGQTVKMSACHAARSGFNSRTSRDYKKYGRAFYNFIEEEMEMNWLNWFEKINLTRAVETI